MTIARVVLLLLAITPLVLFAYCYARYSPWRDTLQGKTLMAQKIAMVAVLLASLCAVMFGDYPGREIVSIVLFAVLVALFWVMFFALRMAQKEAARSADSSRKKE
jgi:hypothetical protein